MKEIIIIIGTILLGAIIFTMIVGDTSSIKASSSKAMNQMIEHYKEL